MERREGLKEFSGLCFGNCYWGQWRGSYSRGEYVRWSMWPRAMSVRRSEWTEVSKNVTHRSIQTG